MQRTAANSVHPLGRCDIGSRAIDSFSANAMFAALLIDRLSGGVYADDPFDVLSGMTLSML